MIAVNPSGHADAHRSAMLGTAQIGWTRDATMRRAAAGDFAVHDEGDIAASASSPPVVTAARPRQPVVLVADDCSANRMLAFELLSCMGIKPLLAADGAEPVALAGKAPLSLILMDLQMPVPDGFAATWEIRHFEREHARKRVPVVAYTSSDLPADPTVLRVIGIDAVLRSLGDVQAFQACVMYWCARNGATLAGGTVPASPESPTA